MYVKTEDDQITLEVTASPTTPLQVAYSYKTFSTLTRRIEDVETKVVTLSNTTPIVLLENAIEFARLILDSLTIYNADNATRTVVLKYTDGTTTSRLLTAEVPVDNVLIYNGNGSVRIVDEEGRVLQPAIEE